MRYYLWELRPYFQHVVGQLVLGSIAGIIMNTTIVLPAILLGQAIDAALAFERGDVGPGAVGWAALAFVGGTLLTEGPRIAKRWWLALVGVSVLLAALLELAPPLLVQRIVDEHLALGRSQGLLGIAVLYLGALAAVQALGFVTEYLTATIAQGALRRLRVQLFAHLQTLPPR